MMVKFFFLYCYRRFLPSCHRLKNNINDFLKGKDKRDVDSPILSSKEVYDEVSQYMSIILGFHFGK
jgi:hypothetical protein